MGVFLCTNIINFDCILDGVVKMFKECLLPLFTMIAIIVGLSKLSKLIDLYHAHHFEAVYGFYSNLYTYCAIIKATLSNNEEHCDEIMNHNYSVVNDDMRNVSDKRLEEELKELSKATLDLFKTAKNQVPPQNDYKNWEDNIIKLQKELVGLKYIGGLKYTVNIDDLNNALDYFVGNDKDKGAIYIAKMSVPTLIFPSKKVPVKKK